MELKQMFFMQILCKGICGIDCSKVYLNKGISNAPTLKWRDGAEKERRKNDNVFYGGKCK